MSNPKLFELARLPSKQRSARIAGMFAGGTECEGSYVARRMKRGATGEASLAALVRRLSALIPVPPCRLNPLLQMLRSAKGRA